MQKIRHTHTQLIPSWDGISDNESRFGGERGGRGAVWQGRGVIFVCIRVCVCYLCKKKAFVHVLPVPTLSSHMDIYNGKALQRSI